MFGPRDVRIIMRPLGDKEYVVSDHLGSTRAVISDMGAILERKDYCPFGDVLATAGTGARTGYINREEDGESGLGSYGVRLYEPEYGRFTSVDVLWEEYEGQQPYHYSFNSPVVLSDITGLGPGDVFKTIDEAASDWANNYASMSIVIDKEYHSLIVERIVHGAKIISYTAPTVGSKAKVVQQTTQSGDTKCGSIHSHGAYDWLFNGNVMSPQSDIQIPMDDMAKGVHAPVFVTTPSGTMLKFDPLHGQVEVVRKDLPSDPKDPDRVNSNDAKNTDDQGNGVPDVDVEKPRWDN